MATSLLMTGKHVPHFGLNSLISTLSFGEIFSYFCHIMEMTLPNILNWQKVKVVQTVFAIFCNLSFFSIYYISSDRFSQNKVLL